MAHTKRFDIGERCRGDRNGGSVRVQINGQVLQIKVCGYKTDKPIPQGTGSLITTDPGAERKIQEFLWEFTDPFHTDKVLDWIKSKTTITSGGW